MKKKSIFVTGGLGFIGSNLIEMLIEQKYNVINIDKVSYSSNFYNTINLRKINFINFISVTLEIKKK
jgi:dTDP-glucose 4,6-dehydratase